MSTETEQFEQKGRTPGTESAALAIRFPRADTLARPPGKDGEMTVPLDTVNDIRSMDAAGRSRSEIARVLHVSRNTVSKHANMKGVTPPAETDPKEERSARAQGGDGESG